MNSSVIQLVVLAVIAVFLILRLRSVLGTRDGFEKTPLPAPPDLKGRRGLPGHLEVVEGGADRDVTDHVPEGSDAAKALLAMKTADPTFSVGEFLGGARSAYEMILMAFERGELAPVRAYLAPEVFEAMARVVEERAAKGLKVETTFGGVSDLALREASFDRQTREAEIAVRFTGEMTSIVRDRAGDVVEGSAGNVRRQRDLWTFARTMGAGDPNWILVATGE